MRWALPDRLLITFLCLGIIFGLMVTSKKKNAPAFSDHSMVILFTGIISLGVYTGGYMAEVIRAGIEAIPKGQGYNYQKKYCPEVKTIFDNKELISVEKTVTFGSIADKSLFPGHSKS